MKTDRAASSRLRAAVLAALLGWLAFGPVAKGVDVDAELILLVDVTQSVSGSEFGQMMEGFAQSFESAGVVDAIQAGTLGRLAVSLVFYTHRNMQSVGIDWMEISDANSAASFAALLRSTSQPFAQPRTGISGALDFAVPHYGSETGGIDNGFTSAVQAMAFFGEGADDHSGQTNGSRDLTVQNSRDAALAAGVDLIGAMTVGAAGSVDSYFQQFVIGGQVGDYPGGVTNATDFGELAQNMPSFLQGYIAAIVPEPDLAVLAGISSVLILLKRRRRPRTT
jgi:hypothetical protein